MANVDPVRIGYISTINYEKGTATVAYREWDNAVSPELPFLAGEYDMPDIDDQVIVLTPKDTTRGIILGKAYSDISRPQKGKKGIWRKEFGDGNYIEYNFTERKFTFSGSVAIHGNLTIEGNLTVNGSITTAT